MSRQSTPPSREPGPRPRGTWFTRHAVALGAIAGLVAGGIWLTRPQPNHPPRATGPSPAPEPASPAPAPAPSAQADFQPLVGRWVRPDGGYVVEVRRVADDGAVDAGYYNPNPINVGRAAASREGSTLTLFVELRDANYPGSTYTLTLDPGSDELRGIYYQAALQQRYEVAFERMR